MTFSKLKVKWLHISAVYGCRLSGTEITAAEIVANAINKNSMPILQLLSVSKFHYEFMDSVVGTDEYHLAPWMNSLRH